MAAQHAGSLRGDRRSCSRDLAGLLAHLSVLALAPGGREGFGSYGRELIGPFDQLVDPVALRLRTSATILGLATGPFRVQESDWPAHTRARVELAETWADSATEV